MLGIKGLRTLQKFSWLPGFICLEEKTRKDREKLGPTTVDENRVLAERKR